MQAYYASISGDYVWDQDIDKTKILIADSRPEHMVLPAIIAVGGRFSSVGSIGSMHGDAKIDGTRDVIKTYIGNINLKVFASNELESDSIAFKIDEIFGNYGNMANFVRSSKYISRIDDIIINPTVPLNTEPAEFMTTVRFSIMVNFKRIYKLVDSSIMGNVNVGT